MLQKKKMNIFVLNHDSSLLEILAVMLEAQNHFAVRAATSEEALHFAAVLSINIDWLVVSLNVPPDGAEPIVQAFRAKDPHLPVLLVAGSVSEQDRKRVEHMRSACWCTGDLNDFGPAMARALKCSPAD